MIYVGIDVARRKHVLAAVNASGEVLIESFVFENTSDGFKCLVSQLRSIGATRTRCRICLEATGNYDNALVSYLTDKKFEVVKLNPLVAANWRKALSTRPAKTDSIDALALASWLLSGNSGPKAALRTRYDEIKTLSRWRLDLVTSKRNYRYRVQTLLDVLFPEFGSFFDNIFCKTATALLSTWPSAGLLASVRIDTLTNTMRKTAKSVYHRNDAERLKALAKASVGLRSEALEFEMVQLMGLLAFLQNQIDAVDARLQELVGSSPLLTVPGIGLVNGASILGKLGDIHRFDSASKVIAFAGCDPTVHQSGDYEHATAHVSKHGSPQLRRALWAAANVARMYDPQFRAYYQKKRDEGKSYQVAMGAVVHKMCRVIFAVLRDDKPYVCTTSSSA